MIVVMVVVMVRTSPVENGSLQKFDRAPRPILITPFNEAKISIFFNQAGMLWALLLWALLLWALRMLLHRFCNALRIVLCKVIHGMLCVRQPFHKVLRLILGLGNMVILLRFGDQSTYSACGEQEESDGNLH